MEILGGAASVFAAVSVADQLATRVKQLYDFWSAVSDAPDNVRALAAGLIPLLGPDPNFERWTKIWAG